MLEIYVPDLTVDTLMARLQQAMTGSTLMDQTITMENSCESLALPRYPVAAPFQIKPVYTLHEFTDYHDADFIRNAYLGILGREPDSNGRHHFLSQLRAGTFSKTEILGKLRYSAEGRRHRVRIKGLLPCFAQQTLGRIPVLGFLVQFIASLVKLPRNARNLRGLESYCHWRFFQGQQLFDEQAQLIEQALVNLQSRYQALQQQMESRHDDLQDQHNNLLGHHNDLQSQHHHLLSRHDSLQDQHNNLLGHHNELQNQHHHLLSRHDSLQDQHNALYGRHDDLQDQHNNLLGRHNDLESQHHHLLDHADQMSAQHEQLQVLYQNLREQHEALRQSLDRQLTRLRQLIEQTEIAKADRGQVGELTQRVRQIETALIDPVQLDRQLDALGQRISPLECAHHIDPAEHRQLQTEQSEIRLQLLDYRRTVLDQQRRVVTLLEETHARLLAPFGPALPSSEQDHTLDALYLSFEDRFRGSREQVKATQQVYLSYLAAVGAGDPTAPVLDIGCGRGEWLELLGEQGLTAHGLDLNRMMVHECHGYGLAVTEGDAIAYLRRQSANSLGAVTGFHIVEHLPFPQLIALLDETLRVLKPGGVAIFETPNSENLVVGAYTFYFDPTHRNPLPPPILQYLAEARGFAKVDILRRHPRDEASAVAWGAAALGLRLNPEEQASNKADAFLDQWIRMALDYAVICRK
ncbi:MAG: methyltransferase domain-containing protein [Candidatus Competibacteraceae bacterium]|nr:methyltransferase domain-containing protein [Candidatus Competibacteraceae bacterium]